jgi:hypothetical protein
VYKSKLWRFIFNKNNHTLKGSRMRFLKVLSLIFSISFFIVACGGGSE